MCARGLLTRRTGTRRDRSRPRTPAWWPRLSNSATAVLHTARPGTPPCPCRPGTRDAEQGAPLGCRTGPDGRPGARPRAVVRGAKDVARATARRRAGLRRVVPALGQEPGRPRPSACASSCSDLLQDRAGDGLRGRTTTSPGRPETSRRYVMAVLVRIGGELLPAHVLGWRAGRVRPRAPDGKHSWAPSSEARGHGVCAAGRHVLLAR